METVTNHTTKRKQISCYCEISLCLLYCLNHMALTRIKYILRIVYLMICSSVFVFYSLKIIPSPLNICLFVEQFLFCWWIKFQAGSDEEKNIYFGDCTEFRSNQCSVVKLFSLSYGIEINENKNTENETLFLKIGQSVANISVRFFFFFGLFWFCFNLFDF